MTSRRLITSVQRCSLRITRRSGDRSGGGDRFVVESAANGCRRALLLLRFPRLEPHHVVCEEVEREIEPHKRAAVLHARAHALLTAATHCDFWVGVTLAVCVLKSAVPSFLKWKVTILGSSVLNDNCFRSVSLYLQRAPQNAKPYRKPDKKQSNRSRRPRQFNSGGRRENHSIVHPCMSFPMFRRVGCAWTNSTKSSAEKSHATPRGYTRTRTGDYDVARLEGAVGQQIHDHLVIDTKKHRRKMSSTYWHVKNVV